MKRVPTAVLIIIVLMSLIATTVLAQGPFVPAPYWNFTHIGANTASTVVQSTPGILHTLVINTKGGSGNTVTIYNGTSTSGTVIAVVDTNATLIQHTYDVGVTALTIAMTGGTTADITISSR